MIILHYPYFRLRYNTGVSIAMIAIVNSAIVDVPNPNRGCFFVVVVELTSLVIEGK